MWQLKGQPGGLQERIWEKEGGKEQKPRTPAGSCGQSQSHCCLSLGEKPQRLSSVSRLRHREGERPWGGVGNCAWEARSRRV